MCGIAGIVERDIRSAEALEDTAWKMVAPLVHRGPDDGGVWTDAEAGVGIGHRRLSIIDLSPAGAQPMVSASGRYVLSYNGEIYNTAELRADLEAGGAAFRGHSDTEVLLEACAAWGVERAVKRLIGMFAFALWDRAERCLWLVRDRIGIKPLYYSATPQRFAFASELTGLRAHPGFDRAIDRDAVEAFLALDYIPAPHSIFRDAKKLEPGKILRVDAANPAQVEIAPYWTLAEAAQKGAADRFGGTFEEAADELERLLADAVKRRMVSDVPLGAFLSGGIDSSTVVALMQKQSARPIRTFSIGFEQAAYDEAPYAKAIAQHLGTDHTELYITDDDIREHGPAIIGHHDEPFADGSLMPTWFLSRLARRDVTVALSGDGGDELFGGYKRHLLAEQIAEHPAFGYSLVGKTLYVGLIQILPKRQKVWMDNLLRKKAAPLDLRSPGNRRALAFALRCPELLHYRLAHGSIRFSRGKTVAPSIAVNAIAEWLNKSASLSIAERQQFIDAAGYLPDDILTKVDRASMMHSLEARVPILDHRIIEFSFHLPPEMKIKDKNTKLVLRKVLGRYAQETLYDRPKKGFRAPKKMWIQNTLRDWANDLLRTNSTMHHDTLDLAAVNSTLSRLHGGNFRGIDFRRIALAAWHYNDREKKPNATNGRN